MATTSDILDLARSQLGVGENPMGSNRGTPYHAWYGAFSQGWEWCAIFVSWLFWYIDSKLIHGLKTAYSGDFLSIGRKYGEEIPITRADAGDIIIFERGDGGRTDHVAIVERRAGNVLHTIEGNHRNRVERVERPIGSIQMWAIRPKYSQPEPLPEPKKEEESMLYEGEGTEFIFGDCYVDRHRYWLHTWGDSDHVRFTLLSHRTNKEKTSEEQTVSGHQDHDMQIVAATKITKTEGSYTLTCNSAKPIRWSLREEQK